MNVTRTIDVKALSHAEKEQQIFPGIQALSEGETIRIVLEFNPAPLVYMFRGEGYQVAYEKEGPDEWVVTVTRPVSKEWKKEQFKELLRELKGDGVSAEAKEKARHLLESVDATTLGILEQELLQEGVSHDEIRHSLCDVHLDIMKDSLVANRVEVEAPHPVNTLMAEHEIILDNLRRLAELVERLEGVDRLAGVDLDELRDIAHHLVEAEKHHQREEEVLFPALEKHDITEPPAIMKMEHVEFRQKKKELYELALNADKYPFDEFKRKVIELGKSLSVDLQSHIFKEDNILYQIALQVLTPEEWVEVKKGCDAIGYCCFTPKDVLEDRETVEASS